MAGLDIDKLLQDVSPDAPCGKALDDDPKLYGLYTEIERAANFKAPGMTAPKDAKEEPPDWVKVQDKAWEMFTGSNEVKEPTKDLRVAVYLVQALVNNKGFVGLNEGLEFLDRLLNQYWESVHPQVDPQDNDLQTRMDALDRLCESTDEIPFRDTIRYSVREKAPLISLRGWGSFTLKNCEDARLGDPSVTSTAAINAAFMAFKDKEQCNPEELQATRSTADAVAQSIQHAESITNLLKEKIGANNNPPNLDKLTRELRSVHTELSELLAPHGISQAGDQQPGTDKTVVDAGDLEKAGSITGGPAQRVVIGTINSREDVIRSLDKLCEYYARFEPSSPVPLLLKRAKRLVSMDFIDILRDLAPNGVAQVELISGTGGEQISK